MKNRCDIKSDVQHSMFFLAALSGSGQCGITHVIGIALVIVFDSLPNFTDRGKAIY